jgi:hypothetical protein
LYHYGGIVKIQRAGQTALEKRGDKMKELEKELTKIAEKNIYTLRGRGDLESRNTDWQDFSNIAVWELKDALREAYELGRAEAKKEK